MIRHIFWCRESSYRHIQMNSTTGTYFMELTWWIQAYMLMYTFFSMKSVKGYHSKYNLWNLWGTNCTHRFQNNANKTLLIFFKYNLKRKKNINNDPILQFHQRCSEIHPWNQHHCSSHIGFHAFLCKIKVLYNKLGQTSCWITNNWRIC